jgi:hypothetical protein
MATKKQRDANRKNARKSTGPKSQAGKEVSRRNSLVHGLEAKVVLLDHEDPAAFENLRDAIYADYLPNGPRSAVDLDMADQLVMTLWRLRRIPVFERVLVAWTDHRMHVTHDQPGGDAVGPKGAKGEKAPAPTALSLANSSQGGADLERLRIGRALEAVLESNALGKLAAHHARLFNQMERLMDWLEIQKRARVGFHMSRTAFGARLIDPEPEDVPEQVAPTPVQGGIVTPTANAVTTNASATSIDWAAGSARGSYVSPTEREARKQAAAARGGTANTAG